jgi:hypothetical protein
MATTKSKQTQWLLLKKHSDIQAIHDQKGISKDKIRKAFDYGDYDDDTEKKIDDYFKKKYSSSQQKLNKLLSSSK